MEGFLPATKSFYADARKCAFKAAQHKIYGIKSKSGVPAIIGSTVHGLVADIREEKLTLDVFLAEPLAYFDRSRFTDNETEDVIDMVEAGIKTDPVIMSPTEKERVLHEAYVAVDAKGKLTRGKAESYHRASDQSFDHIKNTAPAIFHGSLDRVLLRDDGTVLVDDLKTGWTYEENKLERFGYVLLAKALYPKATVFTFAYHFLRTRNYVRWLYELSR